jgi:CheY-like chemotaxis protein
MRRAPDRVCVLVVDDNPDELQMLQTALSGRFEVLVAVDGLDGYALACARQPAAIVLDIAMPLVDGWTVLRKLRTNPTTKDVPVVVLTAMEMDAVRRQALALGARAVLGKPASAADLAKVLDTHIAR